MHYTGDMTKNKNNRVMGAPRGAYNYLLSKISAYNRNTSPRSFRFDLISTRRKNTAPVTSENIANKIALYTTLTSTAWADGRIGRLSCERYMLIHIARFGRWT